MSTKDFLEKDYYKTLGVSKDAGADGIKKAYRKLARQYHPDANKGDAAAEERFKEISEAYDVLSDTKRRAARTIHPIGQSCAVQPFHGPANGLTIRYYKIQFVKPLTVNGIESSRHYAVNC